MAKVFCVNCGSYPRNAKARFCKVEIINYVTGERHEKEVNCDSENVDSNCPSYKVAGLVEAEKVFCIDCECYGNHEMKWLCCGGDLDPVTKEASQKPMSCRIVNAAGTCPTHKLKEA